MIPQCCSLMEAGLFRQNGKNKVLSEKLSGARGRRGGGGRGGGVVVWGPQGSTKWLSWLSKITKTPFSHGNFSLEITYQKGNF